MDYERFFENESTRPVGARCDDAFVYVALADGREVRAPMSWYPFLQKASPESRQMIELMSVGIWWPVLDEGISVKSMLLGWKAPGAATPQVAAE